MSLAKEIVQDKIEVVGAYKAVQVRNATIIKEDGVEINRSFKRYVLQPCTKTNGVWNDTDISNESSEVQGICIAVWSNEIKTSYKEYIDSTEI